MLKFRVVSPSLTENSIYTAYSRLFIQSDNMIAVVQRTFHCTRVFFKENVSNPFGSVGIRFL